MMCGADAGIGEVVECAGFKLPGTNGACSGSRGGSKPGSIRSQPSQASLDIGSVTTPVTTKEHVSSGQQNISQIGRAASVKKIALSH
jgi:hypothetical protein